MSNLSDSALLRRSIRSIFALKSGHFTDILSLPFRCVCSVSAHAPDVASRPFLMCPNLSAFRASGEGINGYKFVFFALFLKVSYLSDLAADNQRANAPRFLVLSLFCLCFFSAFALILSRLFLVFRARNVRFCEVFKCLFFLVFFAQLLSFDRFSKSEVF